MSRKLLAFCLRLVCIEFVYILFSHSPFEQVCKRFPDAETVTLCDIRRRERRNLLTSCSYFAHKLHLFRACKQAQGSPTMNSERAGYIDQAHPLSAPPPLWSREHTPSCARLSQALETVVPVCASAGFLALWGESASPPRALPGLRSPGENVFSELGGRGHRRRAGFAMVRFVRPPRCSNPQFVCAESPAR